MLSSTHGAASPRERFVELFETALRPPHDTFIRVVLSTPTAAAAPLERIVGRLITLRGEPALSLTSREPGRDLVRNLPPTEAVRWLRGELAHRFHGARLETTTRDWQLSLATGGNGRLVGHAPRVRTTPGRSHDHLKQPTLALAGATDWLAALGLVDPAGRVFPSRADKHRQIVRYAEILGHLVTDCGWTPGTPLHLADMGCGRGYLTFAAWHLLRRQRGLEATVTGVEARPALVGESQAIADRLACPGLSFLAGTIAEARFPALDGLLALHACNTATDDAIRRGIELGCRLIVVAPCCQQELRPQLGLPEPFTRVLEHGLFAGRLADWLTDALRALHLEWAGYRVKAIEFVDPEHTPKNLLLAGIRHRDAFLDVAARDRIVALKEFFGVREHALDPLLNR